MKTVSYYRNGQKPVYDNVDMVNQEFMLKVEPGIFRFLFICVDDLRKDKQGNEQLNSVIEEIKRSCREETVLTVVLNMYAVQGPDP